MKSFIATLALVASAIAMPGGGRDPGLPACRDPAGSCKRLPAKSTRECQSLISKSKIPVATCGEPTSVQFITVTETAKPKFWKTTTLLLSSTSVKTEHVNTTVYSTAVLTDIASLTITDTVLASATLTSTAHVNVTETKLVTAKATLVSTKVVDQTQETCKPGRRDAFPALEERGRNDRLPEDCSCFLTATSYTGVKQIKTTEIYTPTIVKTSTVPVKQTVTATWTITVEVTSTAVSTAVQTQTETSTVKFTETISTTWSQTATQTQTAYETKTISTNADVCATAAPLPSGVSGGRSVYDKDVRGVNNFKDCCRSCFKADGCVFYEFDDRKKDCKIFISGGGMCKTDSCPAGKSDISLERRPQDLFGYGPCVGAKKP